MENVGNAPRDVVLLAEKLTTLCRKALVESGFAVAAFGITVDSVLAALAEPNTPSAGILADPTDADVAWATSTVDPALHVWAEWRKAKGWDDAPLDDKSRAIILARLAFGFSPADLVVACGIAAREPERFKRSRIVSISVPLASDVLVCRLLGRQYERPKHDSWLTPFEKAWKARYPDGTVPFGALAKSLAPLVKKHGGPAVERQFAAYLAATPAQYVSIPKFADQYGSWSAKSYAADAVRGLE